MSDHIIKRVRRDIEAARKGVQAGMPKIRIDCNDAARLCDEIGALKEALIREQLELDESSRGTKQANAILRDENERLRAEVAELKTEAYGSHIFHEGHEAQMESLRADLATIEQRTIERCAEACDKVAKGNGGFDGPAFFTGVFECADAIRALKAKE